MAETTAIGGAGPPTPGASPAGDQRVIAAGRADVTVGERARPHCRHPREGFPQQRSVGTVSGCDARDEPARQVRTTGTRDDGCAVIKDHHRAGDLVRVQPAIVYRAPANRAGRFERDGVPIEESTLRLPRCDQRSIRRPRDPKAGTAGAPSSGLVSVRHRRAPVKRSVRDDRQPVGELRRSRARCSLADDVGTRGVDDDISRRGPRQPSPATDARRCAAL